MKLSEQIRFAAEECGPRDYVSISREMLKEWLADARRLERTAAEPLAEAVGLVARAMSERKP